MLYNVFVVGDNLPYMRKGGHYPNDRTFGGWVSDGVTGFYGETAVAQMVRIKRILAWLLKWSPLLALLLEILKAFIL